MKVPVTQFDEQLLPGSHTGAPTQASNSGRQVLVREDGLYCALAYGGSNPMLRIWRGGELVAEHRLRGEPSPPLLVDLSDRIAVWFSVDGDVYRCDDVSEGPRPVAALHGIPLDALSDDAGDAWLLLSRGGPLLLVCSSSDGTRQE